MSSIVIKGNTSGQIELAAPDVAGSTTLTLPTGDGTVITDTAPKTGNVLQVLQDVERSVIVYTSTLADALSISITPSSSTSKILVQWDTVWGRGVDDYGAFYLYRDGSEVSGAVSSHGTGSQINATGAIMNRGSNSADVYVTHANSGSYLDLPNTTSAVTYAIKAKCTYGTNILLNGPYTGLDAGYVVKSISSLTVMEIAG